MNKDIQTATKQPELSDKKIAYHLLQEEGLTNGQITEALEAMAESRIDYVAVVDPDTLADVDQIDGPVLMAVAVFVGKVRLIDNVLAAHEEEENTGLDAEAQRGRGAQRNFSDE